LNKVELSRKKSDKVAKKGYVVPLTRMVAFQSTVERCSKVQVPKLIRWQFKMEPEQVLRVGINAVNIGRGWQFFYTKMKKDGRIRIPG